MTPEEIAAWHAEVREPMLAMMRAEMEYERACGDILRDLSDKIAEQRGERVDPPDEKLVFQVAQPKRTYRI